MIGDEDDGERLIKHSMVMTMMVSLMESDSMTMVMSMLLIVI